MPPSHVVQTQTQDLVLLLFLLTLLKLQVDDNVALLESLLSDHLREQQRLNRSLPCEKQVLTWAEFCSRITLQHFRRMFRMLKESFNRLCTKIIDCVGKERFHPESACDSSDNTSTTSNGKKTVTFPGEVKVAIGIRMLLGRSYLDILPLFQVLMAWFYVIFDDFLSWILAAIDFPLIQLLRDRNWDALEMLSNDFAEKKQWNFIWTVWCN